MSNEEPAEPGEQQGTDAGAIESTDASGESDERQGSDEGAVDPT